MRVTRHRISGVAQLPNLLLRDYEVGEENQDSPKGRSEEKWLDLTEAAMKMGDTTIALFTTCDDVHFMARTEAS